MTTTRLLSAAIGLGVIGTATSQPRAWTKSEERTINAEFVALADGEITLETKAGEIRTFPLDQLSAADRELAKKLAKITPTVKAWPISRSAGNESWPAVRVTVELKGGAAASAFAIEQERTMKVEIEVEDREISITDHSDNEFEMIERDKGRGSNLFFGHPEGGIRFSGIFDEIPKGLKSISAISGKVKVRVGGTPVTATLDELTTRPVGPLNDPALKAAGINVEFQRVKADSMVGLVIKMKRNPYSFLGLQVLDADGKTLEPTGGSGRNSYGDILEYYDVFEAKELKGATLRVEFRAANARKIELPFEFKDVPVKR